MVDRFLIGSQQVFTSFFALRVCVLTSTIVVTLCALI